MLIDIPEERGGSYFTTKWGQTDLCYFPLFSFLKAGSVTTMGLVYFIMWIGNNYNFNVFTKSIYK